MTRCAFRNVAALSGVPELQRKLAQPLGKFLARSCRCRFPRQRFFSFQFRNSGQDFVGRNHPVHRYGVTTIRRTNQAQRSGATGASDHQNPMTVDHLATGETVAPVIERLPFAIPIESLQKVEFFQVGEFYWGQEERHWRASCQIGFDRQSDARLIDP